jgi:hypothetical protein
LLAELLSERGQDDGSGGPAATVGQRAAAGAFESGDLIVESGLPEAECLGGREDAGVAGDEQEPVQAAPGAGPDEGAAERFWQVARVDAEG